MTDQLQFHEFIGVGQITQLGSDEFSFYGTVFFLVFFKDAESVLIDAGFVAIKP